MAKLLHHAGEGIYCKKCGGLFATTAGDIYAGDYVRVQQFEFPGKAPEEGGRILCQHCGAGFMSIFGAPGGEVEPKAGAIQGKGTN